MDSVLRKAAEEIATSARKHGAWVDVIEAILARHVGDALDEEVRSAEKMRHAYRQDDVNGQRWVKHRLTSLRKIRALLLGGDGG
jgi:hypothetical protein